MANDLESLLPTQMPTRDRPLLGSTVLVVEDSRFASEALRLLCLRSGARIRRADTLEHARKHLRVFRPNVVIIDLGLPDGSGTELIEELSKASPRTDVILGMSGDTGTESLALDAGADGFIAKPIANLGEFQQIVLSALPQSARPLGMRRVSNEHIHPDPIALQDDFVHILDLMAQDQSEDMLDYIAQFLAGLARTAEDVEMITAVESLASHRAQGRALASDIDRINALVQQRINKAQVV